MSSFALRLCIITCHRIRFAFALIICSSRPPHISGIAPVRHRSSRALFVSGIVRFGHRTCRASYKSGIAHVGHRTCRASFRHMSLQALAAFSERWIDLPPFTTIPLPIQSKGSSDPRHGWISILLRARSYVIDPQVFTYTLVSEVRTHVIVLSHWVVCPGGWCSTPSAAFTQFWQHPALANRLFCHHPAQLCAYLCQLVQGQLRSIARELRILASICAYSHNVARTCATSRIFCTHTKSLPAGAEHVSDHVISLTTKPHL
jgi:hypothetical protein